MEHPHAVEQHLAYFAHASFSNLFVLGAHEHRVTVASQQLRALNLVHALFEAKLLRREGSCAVVGGGAAGLTAAAAAAHSGAHVTLLERESRVLQRFAANHSRYLHPYLYEWPEPGWDRSSAEDLPFLGWKPGSPSDVVRQMITRWNKIKREARVREHFDVGKVQLHGQEGRAALSWQTRRDPKPLMPDVVILAVGFGVEWKGPRGYESTTYWENDNYSTLQCQPDGSRTRVLVSGTGDGGAIEVLRLRLPEFGHEEFFEQYFSRFKLSVKLQAELSSIENKVRAQMISEAEQQEAGKEPDPSAWAWLTQAYLQLSGVANLDTELGRKQSPHTEVILQGSGKECPISPKAFVLNRLLLSRFLVAGRDWHVRYTHEQPKFSDDKHDIPERRDGKYGFGGTIGDIHEVVLRRGPQKPPLKALLESWPFPITRLERLLLGDVSRKQGWVGEWGAAWQQDPARELEDLCAAIERAATLVDIMGVFLRCRRRHEGQDDDVGWSEHDSLVEEVERKLPKFFVVLEPRDRREICQLLRELCRERKLHRVVRALADVLDDQYGSKFMDVFQTTHSAPVPVRSWDVIPLNPRARALLADQGDDDVTRTEHLLLVPSFEGEAVLEFHRVHLSARKLHSVAMAVPAGANSYEWRSSDRSFFGLGPMPDPTILQRLVSEAKTQGAKVLVLPELSYETGSLPMLQSLGLPVIAAGSHHYKEEPPDVRQRHSAVTLVGTAVRNQHKLRPGTYRIKRQSWREDVAIVENQLVLHIGMGSSFVVVLGSDLEEALPRLRLLRPNWVFVPAMAYDGDLVELAEQTAGEVGSPVLIAHAAEPGSPHVIVAYPSPKGIESIAKSGKPPYLILWQLGKFLNQ